MPTEPIYAKPLTPVEREAIIQSVITGLSFPDS